MNYVAGISSRELRFVNREDDSGDEGLRISKLRYHPLRLQDKYLVHVNPAAYRLKKSGGPPLIKSGNVVLDAFRETDKADYLRLSLDTANNRYWGYDYREDEYLGPVDENTFYDQAAFDMECGDSVNFAVRAFEGGPMIGEGILWNFNAANEAEAGLRLFPEYQGRGLGREAFKALTDFAVNEMKLIPVARCFKENSASVGMILCSGYAAVREDDGMIRFEAGSGRNDPV